MSTKNRCGMPRVRCMSRHVMEQRKGEERNYSAVLASDIFARCNNREL